MANDAGYVKKRCNCKNAFTFLKADPISKYLRAECNIAMGEYRSFRYSSRTRRIKQYSDVPAIRLDLREWSTAAGLNRLHQLIGVRPGRYVIGK